MLHLETCAVIDTATASHTALATRTRKRSTTQAPWQPATGSPTKQPATGNRQPTKQPAADCTPPTKAAHKGRPQRPPPQLSSQQAQLSLSQGWRLAVSQPQPVSRQRGAWPIAAWPMLHVHGWGAWPQCMPARAHEKAPSFSATTWP